MIKYIGSKRTLVPTITTIVSALPGVRTACDLFTGTTRVAQGLKRGGVQVLANDLATYSQVIAQTYIEADADEIDLQRVQVLLEELATLPDVDGYVTEEFCRQARYFQPHNGMRIDAIRAGIDELDCDELQRAILLTSLLEAADRVDSTTGLQMAYLKSWSARSHKPLELRVPELIAGSGGRAVRCDANELAPKLGGEVDLVYIDPPYNQHSYYANYHVWETIVRNDAPENYGIARKRVDVRETKSDYNSVRRAGAAFEQLIGDLQVPWLLVSCSDEGHLRLDHIRELLSAHGHLAELPVDFKRYVGAQIGIHSPAGKKVGKVSHLRNTEHLFLAGPDRAAAERAIELAAMQLAGGAGAPVSA